MTVHLDDIPVKGLKLFVQRLGRHHVSRLAVNLKAVDIHHRTEVVQMIFGGSHSSFPDLTFLDLTVSQNGIDPVILPVHLPRQRHPYSGRDALPQGPGGHIHAGHMDHIGMAGIMAFHRAEKFQLLHGKISLQCQRGIEGGGGVPLGKNQPVPVRGLRGFRVHLHGVEVKHRQDIGHRQRPSDMAGGSGKHSVHSQAADLCRLQGQVMKHFFVHSITLFFGFACLY